MKVAEQAASYSIENLSTHPLPPTECLNVNALAAVFRHTTNSYKPLFFLALLNKLNTHADKTIFTLDALAIEMTTLAWYPLNYFHLSFGKQDQVGNIIARLNVPTMKHTITHPLFQQELNRFIQQQQKAIRLNELVKYVPYRFLSPFFHQTLKGTSDSQKKQNYYPSC